MARRTKGRYRIARLRARVGATQGWAADTLRGVRRAVALVSLLLFAFAAVWPAAPGTEATSGAVYVRTAEVNGAAGAAVFPLAATAGDTWMLRIDGAATAVRLEVVDPRSGEAAARTAFGGGGMFWTAPQTGVWSVRASPAGQPAGRVERPWLTLVAQRQADDEGTRERPTVIVLRGGEPAIAQGAINWSGDEDWFAVGMSARNTYTIYTVLGTLGATRGEIVLPGEGAARPLRVHENGETLYQHVSPRTDGTALIRVVGARAGVGSYALGITPHGGAAHPAARAAPPPAEHRLRGARAAVEPGRLRFELIGDWGAFDAERRVGVWLDSDADGDWDFVVATGDGWEARVWSIAERHWSANATVVGSNGFDSLILRASTRDFGARVRWQAAARHSERGWRGGAAGVLEPRPPIPQRPALWSLTVSSGSEAERAAALRALGVGAQKEGQPVVALDPGHGGEQLGASEHGLIEAHSNRAIALAVRERLEAAGVHVVLTRRGDGLAELNFSGHLGRPDLHSRVEAAHLAEADLFVSIHSNGARDAWQAGLQAWYYPSFAGDDVNRAFSQWMLDAIAGALGRVGYDGPADLLDASCWEVILGRCDPIYVLAPYLLVDHAAAVDWGRDPRAMGLSEDPWAAPRQTEHPTGWRFTQGIPPIDVVDVQRQTGPAAYFRGTMMPAVLLELLFITNRRDAAVLRSAEGRAALVEGVAEGILGWLRREGRLAAGG